MKELKLSESVNIFKTISMLKFHVKLNFLVISISCKAKEPPYH